MQESASTLDLGTGAGERFSALARPGDVALDLSLDMIRVARKNLHSEEAGVPCAFLDEESMAFWLLNAPLPERVDPDRHAGVLASLPLQTTRHYELLVVRRR